MYVFAAVLLVATTSNLQRFETEGIVLNVSQDPYLCVNIEADSRADDFRIIGQATNAVIRPGDRIRIWGHDGFYPEGMPVRFADRIVCLSHGPAPVPPCITGDDFNSGQYDHYFVRLRGIMRDVFVDEIDAAFVYLVLNCDTRPVYCSLYDPHGDKLASVERAVGKHVEIAGVCAFRPRGLRRSIGRLLCLRAVSDLRILEAPSGDLAIPDISALRGKAPLEITACGRHKTVGTVLARYNGNTVLLRTREGDLSKVSLSSDTVPDIDTDIAVEGLPETDLYNVNLSRAVWRPTSPLGYVEESATPCTLSDLVATGVNRATIKAAFHGKRVTLVGTVCGLPNADPRGSLFYIEDGGNIVAIDICAAPDVIRSLETNCRVRLTATCVMEIGNASGCTPFPRIQGVLLALRNSADVEVLSRPSWWTPGRLLAVIGTMFLGLVGIFIWNLQLRRLSERRGRQLADERFARQESDLKIVERTRLAVELHDSMSQNLTGVSMEIRAAKRLADTDGKAMHDYLDLALKTIDSSRAELRNCIWDLRNRALEAKTFDEAIRLTIAQHLGEASAQIRFNIPRERISDDVANAFLRIIRELVTNAIRHGAATRIRIAGSLDGDTLHFSVQDDGLGFDVENAPGMGKGHFGLQGIRERIKAFNGTLTLTSSPGQGVKAVVTLPLEQSGRT